MKKNWYLIQTKYSFGTDKVKGFIKCHILFKFHLNLIFVIQLYYCLQGKTFKFPSIFNPKKNKYLATDFLNSNLRLQKPIFFFVWVQSELYLLYVLFIIKVLFLSSLTLKDRSFIWLKTLIMLIHTCPKVYYTGCPNKHGNLVTNSISSL